MIGIRKNDILAMCKQGRGGGGGEEEIKNEKQIFFNQSIINHSLLGSLRDCDCLDLLIEKT